jgi:hypothetical protein
MLRTLGIFAIVLVLAACASPQAQKTVTITPAPPADPAMKTVQQSPVIKTLQEDSAGKKNETIEALVKPDLTCTLAPDIRTLRIEKDAPKGCSLYYSKLGQETRIAWSVLGPDHCSQVLTKVQSNLENAGFTCRKPQAEAAASAN